ncbi:MAG: riboflavin synthase [Bacillota bacterium]
MKQLFTGLIEEIGIVRGISSSNEGAGFVIGAGEVLSGLKIGESIAVNGPCLTVTGTGPNSFTAWAMPETLDKANLKELATGDPVNLERAMPLGGRMGGHMVSGHVDALVTLSGRKKQGEALLLTFEAPPELLRYIIPKGSVALDGVSLTVVEVNENSFSVGVIPHTAEQTTLGLKKEGAAINLEVDMIGKYVEKMLAARFDGEKEEKQRISISFLQEKGYL